MSEKSTIGISINLDTGKKKFVFADANELFNWHNNFQRKWEWLRRTPLEDVWGSTTSLLATIQSVAERWRQNPSTRDIEHWQSDVASAITQLYSNEQFLFKNEDCSAFILKLCENRGAQVAAGAYAVLSTCTLRSNSTLSGAFFEGTIHGFLYSKEIEWTATAHRELLTKLESELNQKIEDQNRRLAELESANKTLNNEHESILKEKTQSLETLRELKSQSLDVLHQKQNEIFDEILKKHKENIKATEEAFHNKLALSKPIDYWTSKRNAHKRLATKFAVAAAVSFAVLGTALGFVIIWAFGNLGADENPKSWQLGVVIVASFFAVWIIRILVRFLFSNQHLASDADERVTMVQTYLSLLQEGKGVEISDRALIVQQLFRPASDGIVKDDAAPPGLLELASRQK
jgi:Family of unknown function (DUF6161)